MSHIRILDRGPKASGLRTMCREPKTLHDIGVDAARALMRSGGLGEHVTCARCRAAAETAWGPRASQRMPVHIGATDAK